MTVVKSPDAPIGGIAAITSALPHLLPRGPQSATAMLGGATTISAGDPIPLYVVSPTDLLDPQFLDRANPTAWRYLIVASGGVALADVRTLAPSQANLSALIRGPMAERLSQAEKVAEQRYGVVSDSYEARILEVPAIYVTALWLHGQKDIFFPVMEAKTRPGDKVEEDPNFVNRLRQMAQSKVDKANPISQP